MRIVTLLFIVTMFTATKAMIINEDAEVALIVFPTFDPPGDFAFRDLSGGCGGFVDCIEYVGAVIYNVALAPVFVISFLIGVITYVFALFALFIEVTFTGVEGAPWWLNLAISLPILASLAVILYRMVPIGGEKNSSD
jgi:hypothetical protein